MKKTIGAYFEITIQPNVKTIARLVDLHIFEFFNFFKSSEYEFSTSDNDSTLFYVYVHSEVFRRGGWKMLNLKSSKPIPRKEDLIFFKQDIADKSKCWLVDATGTEIQVTLHECVGIEKLAVWDIEQIHARLLDLYNGRPNKMLEIIKLKL